MFVKNIAKVKYFKQIIALLVVLTLCLATILPITVYKTQASNGASEKMLHLTHTAGSSDVNFLQDVTLVKDKTYTVSFRYMFKEGGFSKSEGVTLDIFGESAKNGKRAIFGQNFGADDVRHITPVLDEATNTVSFTFTLSKVEANESGTKNNRVTIVDGNNDCAIGFNITKTVPFDLFITDLVLFDTSDTNKTNLLSDLNTATDLTGWYTGTKTHSFASGITHTVNTFTACLATYNEYIFDIATKPEITAPSKMIYYKNDAATLLGKNATVEAGKSYYVSFVFATPTEAAKENEVRNMSIEALDASNLSKTIAITSELIAKYEYEKYTMPVYLITIPSDATATSAFIGPKLPANSEAYIFNLTMFAYDPFNKTGLLYDEDLSEGVGNICLGDKKLDTETLSPDGMKYASVDEKKTVEVVDYNDSKFMAVTPDTPPTAAPEKMLYVKNNATEFIGVRITIVPGETYEYTFSYANDTSVSKGIPYTAIRVGAINNGDSRSEETINPKLISVTEGEKIVTATYEFVAPSHGKNSNMILLGVFVPAGQTCYLFNQYVTRKNAVDKYNIYPSSFANLDNLNGIAVGSWTAWLNYWDYSSSDAPFKDNVNNLQEWYNIDKSKNLKIVNYDESLFGNTEKDTSPKTDHRMLYFKSVNSGPFMRRFGVTPGATYTFTFSLSDTVDEFSVKSLSNGNRGNINVESTLVSAVDHGPYTTYTYDVKYPETLNTEGDSAFIGVQPIAGSEGYLFDLSLKEKGQTKELLSNGDFSKVLNEWAWGWEYWFAVTGTAGLYEWESASTKLRVYDFDTAPMQALIDDINRDDGEWWNPEDIIKPAEEDVGSAQIQGTVVDQNKTAVANLKLVLKGSDKSYDATTDKNGAFAIKDIIPEFYELYLIDEDGTEVETGFYTTLGNGDKVTVDIVTDTSSLVPEEEELVDYDEEEEEQTVTSFTGTVYTPKLKTVPNLKIYLRGFGETVTDANGSFAFADVPVGDYEIYTILEDGSEYVFRSVTLKEDVTLSVKLKYDVPTAKTDGDQDGSNWWIWVVIGAAALIVAAGGTVLAIVLIKNRKKK